MVKQVKKQYSIKKGRLVFAVLFMLCLAIGITAAIQIVRAQSGYVEAQQEYDKLRQYAPVVSNSDTLLQPEGTADAVSFIEIEEQKPILDLSDINSDYIGWLKIETAVDYPVVRGEDNELYLTTTFAGQKNPSGTIFMDCRNVAGFDAPFTILYGHRMKDGSMFSHLKHYREDGYLAEHPEFEIITPYGETLIYRVFAVKITDVEDMAYILPGKNRKDIESYMAELNPPEGAARFLVLSTCATNQNSDARLLVFAAQE